MALKWFKNLFKKKTLNENEFLMQSIEEENPLAIRTLEKSELEDEASDPLTRTPERDVFDQKTYEKAQEGLAHPDSTTDQHGSNPT